MNYFYILMLLISTAFYAQDGSVDTSFGSDGIVLKNFGDTEVYALSVNKGESGRIAVSGLANSSELTPFIQVYTSNGIPDNSFGDNGFLILNDVSWTNTNINVLNDNSILHHHNGIIEKLLPNGTKDLSFGNNGSVSTTISNVSNLNYSLHEDGSIYLLGIINETPKEIMVQKFQNNGILDTSFGDQGTTRLNQLPFYYATVKQIQFLENSKLLVNYSATETNNDDYTNYVTKLNQNGEVDTSFGQNGHLTIYTYGKPNKTIHTSSTGNFYLSYDWNDGQMENNERWIEKYNPDGTKDTSFGTNGVLNNYTVAFIQENQRLILDSSFPDWEGGVIPSISRHFPGGTIDTSFSFQYNYSTLSAITIRPTPDEKIIIASNDIWYNGPDYNLVVMQFNNSPLGIEENAFSTITVSPNPSKNVFNISSSTSLLGSPYYISNSLGQIIEDDHCEHEQLMLNLDEYSSGLYFLTIQSKTYKLIKY